MRRRWLVAVAALVSLSASCSGGPIRSASATETSTYEARGSVASAAPAFDQIGGCNEATFWAVNHEETVAVEIRTAVPIDRGRVIEFDLAGPGETLVDLQRGTSLRMALCGDVIDERYQLTSSARAVSGTATFRFGAGRSRCADGGYDGTVELSDVAFSDGTRIESLVVTSATIGCFV